MEGLVRLVRLGGCGGEDRGVSSPLIKKALGHEACRWGRLVQLEEFLEQGCKGASWEFLWIFCSSFGEQKLRRSQKQLSECLNNIFQRNEKLRTPLLLPLTSITLEHLFRRRAPDRSLSEGQDSFTGSSSPYCKPQKPLRRVPNDSEQPHWSICISNLIFRVWYQRRVFFSSLSARRMSGTKAPRAMTSVCQ